MHQKFVVALLSGLILLAGPCSAGRALLQTVPGTNILKADTSTRTSGGASTLRSGGVGNANMQLATQAAIRRGSTATPLPAVAASRNAARANAATRTAIGSNAAQSAVRTAVRTNNAAGGTRAGAGIAEATVHGAGKTVTGAGTRAGLAGMSTQSAVQRAATGRQSTQQATRTGQANAGAAMTQTSFNPATGAGARGAKGV